MNEWVYKWWKRVGYEYTRKLWHQTNNSNAEFNYMEGRWKEPQNVYTMQSVLIEQMDSSYESELGGIVKLLNTGFTIVINTWMMERIK